MRFIYYLLGISMLILSCTAEDTPSQVQTSPVHQEARIVEDDFVLKYDSVYDRTSEEIAFVKAYADTSMNWVTYSLKFDSVWKQSNQSRLQPMRNWSMETQAAFQEESCTLFYPFSGPDILHGFTFFPKADQYVLMGLEPVGMLPEVASMDSLQRERYYNSVETSLNDIFHKSYFITKHMKNDLKQDQANGVLPLMCIFLKRMGNVITDVEHVGLDTTGKVISLKDGIQYSGTKGVKISFHVKGENRVRTLYYFKADLADSGIKANKRIARYLESLNNFNTYLKSASYLLHYESFSFVRNIILDRGKGVLQDDSGIAYHYFDQTKWDVTLYGKYEKAVKDFSFIKEEDLRLAYKDTTRVKPLPFDLGYNWGTDYQNMLSARKK